MLLNVLVLDGEIERLPAFGAAMWDASQTQGDNGSDSEREDGRRAKEKGKEKDRKRKRKEREDSDSPKRDRKRNKRSQSPSSSESESESDSDDSSSSRNQNGMFVLRYEVLDAVDDALRGRGGGHGGWTDEVTDGLGAARPPSFPSLGAPKMGAMTHLDPNPLRSVRNYLLLQPHTSGAYPWLRGPRFRRQVQTLYRAQLILKIAFLVYCRGKSSSRLTTLLGPRRRSKTETTNE